jgi:flagellar biosynthetic protein FliR
MTLDSAFLIALLAVFLRTSAMVLASPLFVATGVPPKVRVFFSAALALALAPALAGQIPVPHDLYELAALGAREVAFGMLLGFLVQMVTLSAQVAGSFLDLSIGLGLASVLAPNQTLPTSLLARFKLFLALLLFLSLDGHHLLLQAMLAGYRVQPDLVGAGALQMLLSGLWQMSLIALQIALPVTAVSVVVDATFGIMSRAVPQINILIAGLSGKMILGMVALSLSLPTLAVGVNRSLESAQSLLRAWMGL